MDVVCRSLPNSDLRELVLVEDWSRIGSRLFLIEEGREFPNLGPQSLELQFKAGFAPVGPIDAAEPQEIRAARQTLSEVHCQGTG